MNRTVSIIVIILLMHLTVLPTRSEGQDDGLARKLINSQGCKACHSLEGDGGTVAGSFEEIRAKRSRAEILLKLVEPAGKHDNRGVADFSHLTQAEIETLVDFIHPEL